jgi:hypothetical protein
MQGLMPADGMLNSLLGVAGFIPAQARTLAPAPVSHSIAFTHSVALSRFAPPDPPPPRA